MQAALMHIYRARAVTCASYEFGEQKAPSKNTLWIRCLISGGETWISGNTCAALARKGLLNLGKLTPAGEEAARALLSVQTLERWE